MGAKDDIAWWHACLEAWNGRSLLVDPTWLTPKDSELYVDASNVGYGIVCGTAWSYGTWDTIQQSKSIEWRELFPIVLVCLTMHSRLANRGVLVHCDNESVCAIWKTGTSKSPDIMCLLRVALLEAARHNLVMLVTHISGTDNSLADALSRTQLEKFRHLHPGADPRPAPMNTECLSDLMSTPWPRLLQVWRRVRPPPSDSV